MAKSIVFDTGPIISLAVNNLLWVLEELKKDFDGDFLIPEAVKRELVDVPIHSKRFKFEALQVLYCIKKGILKVVSDGQMMPKAESLLKTANSVFIAKGKMMQIVHYGEMEALATALANDSHAIAIDERTTRLLIENPQKLRKIMEHKLHTDIKVNNKNLTEFRKQASGIRIIRSIELVTIAYEKGILDKYIPVGISDPKRELIDGLLWSVKLSGCSVSEDEIDRIINMEIKGKI